MPFKYEINGSIYEFDNEPTEQEIDEVALQNPIQKTETTLQDSNDDAIKTKKYLAETIGIPQWAEDAVVGPIAETIRGFASGTASFYNKLDAASKFVENTTGLKRGGIFQDWSEQAKSFADSIPETKQNPFNKFVFQAVGGTVPVLTQFSTTPGGNIAKFAALEAIEEYGKLEDPNFKEGTAALLEGSMSGATVGMAFGSAPALFTKAKEVMAKAGKSAAKKFITFITSNKELSKDFVKNPDKYSVFKKTIKTQDTIKQENYIIEQELKKKHRIEKESFNLKQNNDKFLSGEAIKESKNNLSQVRTDTINDMASKKKLSLETILKTNERAIESSNQALNRDVTSFMDNTLNKYKLLKQQKGEAVGEAIRAASEQNPSSTIPFSAVDSKIRSVVKESPFKFAKRSSKKAGIKEPNLLEPRTAISADTNDIKQINALMNEIDSMRSVGFPLLYLQELKNSAYEKAAIANTAGKNEVRIFWQKLAKAVNPAEIVTKDKALSKQFSNIAKANNEFSTFLKQYDRAMDGYFKKNALGEYVPDVNKALTSIIKGDTVTIREMKLADMALPQEDRILPGIKNLLNQADDIVMKQKANVNLVKNRFELEEKSFKKSSKQALDNLAKEQRFVSQEEKNKSVLKLREFISSQEDEYNAVRNKLAEAELFYKNQDKLR